MRKLLRILLVIYSITFALSFTVLPEISVIPLGGFLSVSICTIFYTIHRWGFDEINDIKCMDANNLFALGMYAIYAVLILAGHAIAYYALR